MLFFAGGLLSGCGGDGGADAPAGSAANPLVGQAAPSTGGRTATPPPGEGGASSARAAAPVAQPPTHAKRPARAHAGTPARSHATTPARSHATTPRRQKPLAPAAGRPCSLVTKAQAGAIIGAAVTEPLEAPLGPTCIYQTPRGKPYITLSVQKADLGKLRARLRAPRAVSVAHRTAYCAGAGAKTLYVPVGGGRVLTVSAACTVAARFAALAAPQLTP
jgi:hypothetical protein